MRFGHLINIAHDLIAGNIYPSNAALLANRNWARHLHYAEPEPRNAYGYPVAQHGSTVARHII